MKRRMAMQSIAIGHALFLVDAARDAPRPRDQYRPERDDPRKKAVRARTVPICRAERFAWRAGNRGI
jgi:hypothetical protein